MVGLDAKEGSPVVEPTTSFKIMASGNVSDARLEEPAAIMPKIAKYQSLAHVRRTDGMGFLAGSMTDGNKDGQLFKKASEVKTRKG